jgi:hypothetical protein
MTSSTPPENRVSGIGFGDLTDQLLTHEYPATTEEVVDTYGEYNLTFPDGEHSLAEVLAPLLDDGDGGLAQLLHDSADDVQQTILNAAGEEAVGRVQYSDRDRETQQEAKRRGQVSF